MAAAVSVLLKLDIPAQQPTLASALCSVEMASTTREKAEMTELVLMEMDALVLAQ